MEKESQPSALTLEEFLGATRNSDELEIGLVNETKYWIYRRALDYLTIGFATDVDQNESDKDQRYEEYLSIISQDLKRYSMDVASWNESHLINTIPSMWEIEHEGTDRRPDLPSVEVCKKSIIMSDASRRNPTREELVGFATAGMDFHYDDALRISHELLESKISDVMAELPTAPFEEIEDGVRTQSQLEMELKLLQSRLNAVESIRKVREQPDVECYAEDAVLDTADNLSLLQVAVGPSELSPITGHIYVVRQIGSVGVDLVLAE